MSAQEFVDWVGSKGYTFVVATPKAAPPADDTHPDAVMAPMAISASPRVSSSDANNPSADQEQKLRELGRSAARIQPDGDCWFTSVIEAARNHPDHLGVLGILAGLSPTGLRGLLSHRLEADSARRAAMLALVGNDEAEYGAFLQLLRAPGGWAGGLFDGLLEMAPDLLGIRVVVIMEEGNLISRGPSDAPTLYLVHTVNHYMPALLPDASARLPQARIPAPGWRHDQIGTGAEAMAALSLDADARPAGVSAALSEAALRSRRRRGEHRGAEGTRGRGAVGPGGLPGVDRAFRRAAVRHRTGWWHRQPIPAR